MLTEVAKKATNAEKILFYTGAGISELLVGAGSSLEVHPASSLFLSSKTTKTHFNLTQTKYDYLIDHSILGDVAITLPLFVEAIKEVLD